MRALPALLLIGLLTGCRPASTVVIVTVRGAEGREIPLGRTSVVLLPYDRDSVGKAMDARIGPRPDTLELTRLMDTLRAAYARLRTAGPKDRPAAQQAFDRLQASVHPRMLTLQMAQHAWRDSAYGGWDTLTLALTHRLSRDPFTDTTDQRGVAIVSPKMSGPWWITLTMWDVADPYSEWYWNLPLVGDTLRLSPANAEHRTRF